jgi:hypothetical protein
VIEHRLLHHGMGHDQNAVALEMLTSGASTETSSFGHRFSRHWDQDGSRTQTYPHLAQISEDVSALHKMVRHILTVMPADKGGRPRKKAMWHWVVNMRVAWTEILDRPFTFHPLKSGPVTTATRFCWESLQLIDPNADWVEFCTAMRKGVRLGRPGQGRRRR